MQANSENVFFEDDFDANNFIETNDVNTGLAIINYVVNDTDDLEDIFNKFGITYDDLVSYNDLDSIMLKPGIVLRIPCRTCTDEEKLED